MKTIVFFNNKGGVGKTSLVYHIAWMFSELGVNGVAVDLDPQSNLTTAFLPDEKLESLWPEGDHPDTVVGAIRPLLDRLGDVLNPHVEPINESLAIVPGDLGLSAFEDRLAEAWTKTLDDNAATAGDAFRVTTAFYRLMASAASGRNAQVVLVDVGPNLGAINRAALVASDYVVVPLAADLFSLQGLQNLGPTLRDWRRGWQKRRLEKVPKGLLMPQGLMEAIGYVMIQPAVRMDRPVKAYQRWSARIPRVYQTEVLGQSDGAMHIETDPNMLAMLKHYRSLMPLAQDARKPMFLLKPADGAIGGHAQAVRDCYADFEQLSLRILDRCGLAVPSGVGRVVRRAVG